MDLRRDCTRPWKRDLVKIDKQHQAQETPRAKTKLDAGAMGIIKYACPGPPVL